MNPRTRKMSYQPLAKIKNGECRIKKAPLFALRASAAAFSYGGTSRRGKRKDTNEVFDGINGIYRTQILTALPDCVLTAQYCK